MSAHVVVEEAGQRVSLPDEAIIGRGSRADLRIEDAAIHRLHAAVLSDDGELYLRSLSRTPIRISDPTPVEVFERKIVLDQLWHFGARTFHVIRRERPTGLDQSTRRPGAVWEDRGDAVHIRASRVDVSLKNMPGRVLGRLLAARGEWVEEERLIGEFWPKDLKFEDRRTRGNSLNVVISNVNAELDGCGLGKRVESGGLEPGRATPTPGGRPRTHVRVVLSRWDHVLLRP